MKGVYTRASILPTPSTEAANTEEAIHHGPFADRSSVNSIKHGWSRANTDGVRPRLILKHNVRRISRSAAQIT